MQHHSQGLDIVHCHNPKYGFGACNTTPAPMMCSRLWRCIIEQGNTSSNMIKDHKKSGQLSTEWKNTFIIFKKNQQASPLYLS
ncbi:hypothetical protein BpHYR1_050733 [Brachionus plicatilis]|uniref:Uncharacterized protein n=1 Tax=Brachionus plicatilis TaxID=10195 RepID=A0A3M7R2W0_BRAPC|nr:hypothetical protein BpHYR1_050733 [Brachionus plicatilis]